MQTPVTCPRCQTPFAAEVFQLIDIGQAPEMKTLVLSGQLNVANCPSCGLTFPVLTPLVYHDPEHEIFMIHVPMELNMPTQQREQMIGRFVQQVMNSLPPEKRKAYLFTPEEILTMQTFQEKILATEGITPDMIARQRKQSELIQKLTTAERDVAAVLLDDNKALIDETFFAILSQAIEAVSQSDNKAAIRLINTQAKLMQTTPVGRQLEKRQTALRAFQKEAQQEGLTTALFLKHLLANQDDATIVDNLIMLGQQALNYELFAKLSEEIERKEKLGGATASASLVALREKLLEVFEELQRQSQEMLAQAGATLQALLEADDMVAAVREHMEEIDDAFMYVLSMNVQQLEQGGREQEAQLLRHVHSVIINEMESQAPPEVRFLNQLIRTQDEAGIRVLLQDNAPLVNDQLLQLLQAVAQDAEGAGQQPLVDHINVIVRLVNEFGPRPTSQIVTPGLI